MKQALPKLVEGFVFRSYLAKRIVHFFIFYTFLNLLTVGYK